MTTPNGPDELEKAKELEKTTEPTVKMVPESQLLALKAKHKRDMDTVKQSHDELYQKHLQLGSEKESLEERVKESSNQATVLEETKYRLELSEYARAVLNQSTVEQRKANLVSQYKIDPEVLKDKTPDELGALETAAQIFSKPKAGQFAIVAPGGGGAPPDTALERANRILEEAMKTPGFAGAGKASFTNVDKED